MRSKKNRCILLGMTEAAAVELQYRGRKISQEDILYIRALIERHPKESRRALSTSYVKPGSGARPMACCATWYAAACFWCWTGPARSRYRR